MNINKYDRQIRIWGSKGQKKLSQSKIMMIGCEGVTIQAAKNLILPGICQIDIYDYKIICVQDLSNSFFYQYQSIGQLRGQIVCKNLIQMNPDVTGKYYNKSIQQILQLSDQDFKKYDIVICGNLLEDQNENISNKLWNLKIPVIFATIVGFIFHVRSQKQTHIVQSQNIKGKKYYLRLHEPFQGLQIYCSKQKLPQLIKQLKNCNNEQQKSFISSKIGKIIYPIFLIQVYKTNIKQGKTSASHMKSLLNQWKSLLKQNDRDNINEALSRCFDLYQTPDNFLNNINIFEQIINYQSNEEIKFFDTFLKAVNIFWKIQNHIPQPINLPDINTTTQDYLQIKNIYKAQHQKNKQKLIEIIKEIDPNYQVNSQLLSEYINNIDALQIIRMKPYYQQLKHPDIIGNALNYKQDQKNIYISLRAYKLFQKQHKRPPNPNDYNQMLKISEQICQKWKIQNINKDFIKQICRYEGKNIISMNSIAGAIIGQQSIKILTNCFTPMNNGYLFDGIHCKGYLVAL